MSQNVATNLISKIQKLQSEASQPKVTKTVNTNSRLSQKAILSGVIRKRKLSETNGSVQSAEKKTSDDSDAVPSKQVNVENVNSTSHEDDTSVGALKCIGILPGICGTYEESSDSEKSTDTDDDYDYSKYDWIGRKVLPKGAHGGCE